LVDFGVHLSAVCTFAYVCVSVHSDVPVKQNHDVDIY